MYKSIIIITCVVLGYSVHAGAQNVQFLTSGNIEFERSDNMYARIRKLFTGDDVNSTIRFEQYKRQHPQFKLAKSKLVFSKDESLFTPEKGAGMSGVAFSGVELAMQMNIVYTNYQNSRQVVQKTVFEETFLVKDNGAKITWKITDETREIAGFNCRRANGLILDSIYLVAFYTDEIPVSGGPESFGGLPGMILGVAIPQEHVTWFAKSVKQTGQDAGIKAPAKGRVTDRSGLQQLLRSRMKGSGLAEDRFLLPFFL